jgi:hypothetical protein
MSKNNPKKYVWWPVLFKAKCIKPTGMLFPGWRNVIKEDDTKYLIKFNSGAAHWYSKDRFRGKYQEYN